MSTRFVLAAAALACALAPIALGGCGDPAAPVTKDTEALMRRPIGQTKMPPEAMRAMQKGNAAATRARQQQGR
jgi:hypothetical protein